MKDKANNSGNLYDVLKKKEQDEQLLKSQASGGNPDAQIALDDTERVKVLSPGKLVTKRFFRNRLAMVGLVVLITMFSFAFIGPLFYPYSQTEIFYKFDYMNINYASAIERTENASYTIPGGPAIPTTIANRFNSYINELEEEGLTEKIFLGTDGGEYIVTRLGDRVYTLSTAQMTTVGEYRLSAEVATYTRLGGSLQWTAEQMSDEFADIAVAAIDDRVAEFEYEGVTYIIGGSRSTATINRVDPEFVGSIPGDGFVALVENGIDLGEDSFEYGGITYRITDNGGGAFEISEVGSVSPSRIASTFVFDSVDVTRSFTDEFIINTLFAIYSEGEFTVDGNSYTIVKTGDEPHILDASGSKIAALNTFSIRRYTGQDTLTLDFKETVRAILVDMKANDKREAEFVYALHDIDADGNFIYDENGNPVYADFDINIERKHTGEFVLSAEQITYLIDIFAPPSRQNILGTDGDGMDILARMMYGGRVSLMVGFIVVFLELVIGVIMGGISGFFGKWVDTLIMRIVDVFYCIPGMPILIIMGAMFDRLRMDPYERLMWMMAILGFLGWAPIARLVRGQILSLREQEFMIAQEATGMKVSRRIFRHLIPNVMPQLIVAATMGVGSVIIFESTLSFLGLGVKHPMATWGTMINAVTSSAESMIKYAYIWVPVGLLICLTVIAFNFSGDGLRDAFDPKMKR